MAKKREDYYFSDDTVRSVSELQKLIEIEGCRQINLVDANKLSKLSKDSGIIDIKSEYIVKLWQLGFVNADIIYSDQELNNIGLVELFRTDKGEYCYADERKLELGSEGYLNSFSELEELPEEIIILFHPFRCFVLYHINRIFKLNVSVEHDFINYKYYDKWLPVCLDRKKGFTSNPETFELFKFWNNMTSLCSISETASHSIINKKVKLGLFGSFDTTLKKIEKISEEVIKLFELIGEEAIEYYRQEICSNAESIDPNKDLHLIIRLMKTSSRDKLKGNIAGAMLFLYMAECLRRNLEIVTDKEYPEEDDIGFGFPRPETKDKLQGGRRVLDGNRLIVNQFLRKHGLDYGVRVNVYVEGDTEYHALSHIFSDNSSVVIKNLRGQVVERGGKGVSFRESLRNDIETKTFSLIVLDEDKVDNVRVVKQAAKADEICGLFFISDPDFEMENFSISELSEIAFELGKQNGIDNIEQVKIQESTKDVSSGEQFLEALRNVDCRYSILNKGKDWGIALIQYAVQYPRSEIFGDKDDRLINRVIEVTDQCYEYMYEPTYQDYKVDPDTGELIPR